MKICSTCKKEKELTAFQKRSNSDPSNVRNECKLCRNTKSATSREELRLEVLEAYGNQCVCCEEKEKVFLAIDHVNDDGHEHRRKLGSRSSNATFRWLKKNAYPPTFQILCFNCNEAKKYGVCPHKLAKVS
jgi:hypothetical protein